MFVNPYLFFQLKEGQIIVWDYKNHQQYELEEEYFYRLKALTGNTSLEPIAIDQELEEGLLLSREPLAQKEWGWDEIARIFHVGTSDIAEEYRHLSEDEWIEQYLNYCEGIKESLPPLFTHKQGESVALPEPNTQLLQDFTLLEAFTQRKTCRSFEGRSISLEGLSTLLFTSLGCIHGKGWAELQENDLAKLGMRKAFPSGGGLHPEEAYVIALRVEGLESGLYHYCVEDHSLTRIKTGDFEEPLISLLYGQYFAKGLSCGIFLTARFEKTWWKYPDSRSYRVALLDIGHASQTVLLAATALGLQTWLTAAFSDTGVEEFLGLQETTEAPILFLGVGYGDNSAIDPKMFARVKERKQPS